MEKGQLWIKYVSPQPATQVDVINLQENLDLALHKKYARENGVCAQREELFGQIFDELIRQITINCNERGMLLVRVRDEYRMVLAHYQNLYESSIAFGMRKALQAQRDKDQMVQRINRLDHSCRDLEDEI